MKDVIAERGPVPYCTGSKMGHGSPILTAQSNFGRLGLCEQGLIGDNGAFIIY